MLRKLIAASRRSGPGRRLAVGAGVCVAILPVGVAAGIIDGLPGRAGSTAATTPEIRLDRLPPRSPPEEDSSTTERKQAPVVVQALPPGARAESDSPSGDEPPRRIAEEDAKLRKELKHLKALEAEQRRVAKMLNDAGAIGGGVIRGSGELIWPITGPLTSPFGQRWGRLHAGIDISAPAGTPIRAADSGRVVLAGSQGGYGLYTCVQHGASFSTCYAHQSRLGTSRGAAVRQGQVIGNVGNTGHSFGNHLHFETRVRGRPVDPMGYL